MHRTLGGLVADFSRKRFEEPDKHPHYWAILKNNQGLAV
jgi:hypothetical protein